MAHKPTVDRFRLIQLIRDSGLTHAELARRVGVEQPTITRLTTGEQAGSKYLHKIASELKTSPAYLIRETDNPGETWVQPPSPELVAADLNLVPVRELDLSSGMGLMFPGDGIKERFQFFPRAWLDVFTKSEPEHLLFAHAVGDAMSPTMFSGDIVLIDRRQHVVKVTDLIWAFAYEGMTMVKRLGPGRDGHMEILSDNPAVRPRSAMPSDLRIMGRVVAIVRKM